MSQAPLPDEVTTLLQVFRHNKQFDELDSYIRDLRNAGWTLRTLGEALGLTREAVRLRESKAAYKQLPYHNCVVPLPPVRERVIKKPRVVKQVPEQLLSQLKELLPLAQRLRGAMREDHPYRVASRQFTKLAWEAHTKYGVSVYTIAKQLGTSVGTIQFRFVRYGYKTTNGKSGVYQANKYYNNEKELAQ